jgi:hypothetical protein
MGRALSALQEGILAQAYRNRADPRRPGVIRRSRNRGAPDLPYQQIFARLLGWPISHAPAAPAEPARSRACAWSFDPAVVGETRYALGTAAVSRALRRLARRGLVVYEGWCPGGATLTPEGVRVIRGLDPMSDTGVAQRHAT